MPVQDLIDPWSRYQEYRRSQPVRRLEGAPVVEVYRHADIRHVLTSDDFTVAFPFRISKQILGETLLDIDGHRHAQLRRAAASFFDAGHVQQLVESLFEPLADILLDGLASGSRIDFVSQCAAVFPMRTVAALIGVHEAEVGPLYKMVDYLVEHLDGSKGDFATASRYRDVLRERLGAEILPRGEGPLARHINGLGADVDQSEKIGLLLLMLFAGIETSISTLANTLSCLLRHPHHLDAMSRADGFTGNALLEAIRWEPAQHETVRFARHDCEVAGMPVAKGTALKLYLASANRDEAVYRDASQFNPMRDEKHNLSFGLGKHSCLGKKLALSALETFISRFFTRFSIVEGSVDAAPISGAMFRRPDYLHITLEPVRRDASLEPIQRKPTP